MTLNDLSATQCQAVLDLAVLAMYLDGHLAAAEDSRVKRLLTDMGLEAEYDRNREFDAAVTRARPYGESIESARARAVTLSQVFENAEQRRLAYSIIEKLVALDEPVTEKEARFLSTLKEVLGQ